MKNSTLFKQPNPLIDCCPAETLANVQSMLARIQVLQIEQNRFKPHDPAQQSQGMCPGNQLYIRLLSLVSDAINDELEKAKQRDHLP